MRAMAFIRVYFVVCGRKHDVVSRCALNADEDVRAPSIARS